MSRKKEIGERIKVMRMSRGMSQIDLANALHCGQSTVAMWETGKRMPDLDMVDFLADVFNTPPYAILYSENEIENIIKTTLSFTPNEMYLVEAYRAADETAKAYALEMLLSHPAKEKANLA